jgi:hypothetical protein
MRKVKQQAKVIALMLLWEVNNCKLQVCGKVTGNISDLGSSEATYKQGVRSRR